MSALPKADISERARKRRPKVSRSGKNGEAVVRLKFWLLFVAQWIANPRGGQPAKVPTKQMGEEEDSSSDKCRSRMDAHHRWGAEPPPIMTIIGVIFGSDNEPWSRRSARQALIFMFGFNVRENPCDEKLGFANSLRGSNCQRVARCTGCTVPWRNSLSGTVRPNGSRLHRGRANRRDRTYHRGKTFDIHRTAILRR